MMRDGMAAGAAEGMERAVAAFLGDPQIECVAVSSPAEALYLALQAVGLDGGEAIAAVHCGSNMDELVSGVGSQLCLVDISPETLNIDVTAIEGAITPRTRAILITHYAGLAVDMLAVLDIARPHGLRVVEDASQALSATLEKELIGTLGSDAAIFSLGANKALMTEGCGVLVTRNAGVARHVRTMRSGSGSEASLCEGVRQLGGAHDAQLSRQRIARRFNEMFVGLALILPPLSPPGDRHAWHQYVLCLADNAPVTRDAFVASLLNAGVELVERFDPGQVLAQFPQYRRVFERSVSLLLDAAMTTAQIEHTVEAVRRALMH